MTVSSAIRGFGHYAPEKVLTNHDLERMVDTSDEWITTRTGIKERRIVAPGQCTSDMALEASKKALADAGMQASELTHIFVATLTPDAFCPSTSAVLEEKLGIKHAMVVDLNAACSGFLYTLQVARAMVALDPSAKVLVAASETLSHRVNWEDRASCVLFGDGAGAAVVTAEDGGHKAVVQDIILSSDGSLAPLLTIPGGGSAKPTPLGGIVDASNFIHLSGSEVFKHAVREMEAISRTMLEKHGLSIDDIDVFVPHQANLRIIDALAKRLGIDMSKVFVDIERFGNTSAAALSIALSDALEQGFIKPGNRVLLATFGAGFTWGSGLLQF